MPAVGGAGVEKAMSMAAPPLWQTPHAPSIGGSGAFRRPLPAMERVEEGMLPRLGSADPAATRLGDDLSGGQQRGSNQSPQRSRPRSAEDSSPQLPGGFFFAAPSVEQKPATSHPGASHMAAVAWSPTLRANGEMLPLTASSVALLCAVLVFCRQRTRRPQRERRCCQQMLSLPATMGVKGMRLGLGEN